MHIVIIVHELFNIIPLADCLGRGLKEFICLYLIMLL